MKRSNVLLSLLGLIALAKASAAPSQTMEPGERHQVLLEYHNEFSNSDGSEGSSQGRQAITVRLIGKRDGGQELEFALPDSATEQDRLREWQLPARIFVAANGRGTLLNASELEVRRNRFLAAAKLTQAACGKWIFTWNAFKIECDPQSALEIAETYRLQPQGPLTDGAPFTQRDAVGSAVLACSSVDGGGKVCSATLPVDAAKLRREKAEADVVVGEINGHPVALADALKAYERVEVEGTIETVLAVDADGSVTKRTTIVRVKLREPDGKTETSTSTSVLTRTRL